MGADRATGADHRDVGDGQVHGHRTAGPGGPPCGGPRLVGLLPRGRRGPRADHGDRRREGLGVARKALADAVDRGYVLRNVADLAHPPSQRTARSPSAKAVWSPAQLRAFLTAATDDRLYAALLLLATTGMRRGEVAGLRGSTVDLDGATLTVR